MGRRPTFPLNALVQLDPQDEHLRAISWSACGKPPWVYAYNRKKGFLHRLVMGVTARHLKVDHRNGDTLDCRRENLRVVSNGENTLNLSGPKRHNTSGFLGVDLVKRTGRWRARLRGNTLGTFATAEEANEARLSAEKEMGGIPRREHLYG